VPDCGWCGGGPEGGQWPGWPAEQGADGVAVWQDCRAGSGEAVVWLAGRAGAWQACGVEAQWAVAWLFFQ
jgi:hypothetical protein